MRPQILFPLFAGVGELKGVGPNFAKLIAKAAGPRVVDLLWHLPSGVLDWSKRVAIGDAPAGEPVTLKLLIVDHVPPRLARLPYKIRASDESGYIDLVFFKARGDYLQRTFPTGKTRYVSGRVESFNERPQLAHPERVLTPEAFATAPGTEPIYPTTERLAVRVLGRAVAQAVAKAPELAEWQDAAWLKKRAWPSWHDAIGAAHAPKDAADLEVTTPARARLAFDELLANQLALNVARAKLRRVKGRALVSDGHLRAKAIAALPYQLTNAQKAALAEIDKDLAAPQRMLRLLQGDVGAGKTVVAFLAMLTAVERGCQGALMAPTEVLVRQHGQTLSALAASVGVSLGILTGRERGRERDAVLSRLQEGTLDILVGTHALISEDVLFHDLGVVVIDEQHRFGVHQRLALSSKAGEPADILVMTATPIPRTLALTAYGDMDMTRLGEKPPGRKPIATRALPLARLEEVIEAVGRAIKSNERVFWVCPLVEENDELDVTAAEKRFAELEGEFSSRVRLLHGRMKVAEKDAAIADFRSGRAAILVATTVIEVGVDVPDATVIVIEHAERFGLAQLHQLRGRVGRGAKPSSCILLYQAPLGETARARLDCLRQTEDGFIIAEEDLRLRGAGQLLGERQSGLPLFRLASLAAHGELIAAARDDARLILARDPDLKSPRGEALRVLLYLFEQDEAVRTLRSG